MRSRPRSDHEPSSDTRWLLAQMFPLLHWQLIGVACMILNASLLLVEPLIVKEIFDRLIPARNIVLLCLAGTILLAVTSSRLSVGALSTRIIYHVNQKFVLALRMKLFRHLNALSADYHEVTPVGTNLFVIHESLNELGELSADLLGVYLRTVVLFTGTLVLMSYLDMRLTLAVVPLVAIFVFTVSRTTRDLQHASESVQDASSRSIEFLQEHLAAVVQVQLLTRERLQACKAFRVWSQLARAGYDRNKAECLSGLLSSIIIVGGEAAILCYGTVRVVEGALTIGGLIAFYRCTDRLFDPLYFTIDLNTRFRRAAANVHRIRECLSIRPSITDSAAATDLSTLRPRGDLVIQGTSFGYRSHRKVIKNVSLGISAGERLAIVGPSGCGKSTLAKLIARLYDVDEGGIYIDGIDVRKATVESVRSRITHVPQHTVLFNSSLEENLRYGDPRATRSELEAAAYHSGLLPVIERLPRGWKETLGPSGGLLSGGERQRVAIARALLRRPSILILDESTAELDAVVERTILAAINDYLSDSTLIIISHRLSSIMWVDRIVVFSQGELVDSGNHQQLYSHHGLYTSLFNQQRSTVFS